MSRFIFCISATCLACACGAQPSPQALPPVVYACEDGSRFTIEFTPGSARVTEGNGRTVDLQQQRAASGIWYAADRQEFRGKGDDAIWTVEGVAKTCRVTRQ